MILVVSILLLISCASTPKPEPNVEEGAVEKKAESQKKKEVELVTFPIFSIFKDGVEGIKVNEVGEIYMVSAPTALGKIAGGDGKIMDMDGTLLAHIDAQDRLISQDGKPLVMISEKGELDNGSGKLMQWSKEGHWMMGAEDTGFTLVPNNPALYRISSMVLFLYLSVGAK